jgi:probable HAF family extracellular repeat protein
MTADGGGAPRAVLWSDGGEIPLGPPDARESVVVDVDERGRALIGYVAADGSRRVALWKDGAGTEIAAQPPDQIATAGEHRPVAVDEGGAVVVNVVDAVGAPLRSYLWRDGVATDLGSLGGGGTAAVALNGQGQVAGTSRTAAGDRHAFLWTGGTLTDLGTLGGPTSAPADGPGALNDAGEVVGSSETATGETHAFVWRDGALVDLGTLGGAFAEAVAINAEGTVTGTSTTAGGDRHPFLWYEGTIGDLGTLGGAHGEALAMNEAGDVAGTAQGADGVFRAVLWTCRPPV